MEFLASAVSFVVVVNIHELLEIIPIPSVRFSLAQFGSVWFDSAQ